MTQKTLRGIALRRSGRVSLKRPAAGGESCEQDSFLFYLSREDFRLFIGGES